VRPYSRADAPYFRSNGFFVRIGGLAIVIGVAIIIAVAAGCYWLYLDFQSAPRQP